MKALGLFSLLLVSAASSSQDLPYQQWPYHFATQPGTQQPYPFASTADYPDIPGLCIVPAWEYPYADQDGDGIATSTELQNYCNLVHLYANPWHRVTRRVRP